MPQQFDYLIVGAGAMGMAFADSLLSASDAQPWRVIETAGLTEELAG